MRKSIFAAVPLAVLALAAPAAAHSSRHATTYKAKVVAVQAAPPATAAKHGKAREAVGIRGEAQLVDGSRRDKVQLHVKGLEAGTAYSWSVRSATGDDDACAGEAVDAFEYDALNARRRGHSKARSRSRTFTAEDGVNYAVVVTDADGADVACGEFLSKADRKAAKAKRKTGNGKHEASGDDSAGDDLEDVSGDDDAADVDEDVPGDDAPGDDD